MKQMLLSMLIVAILGIGTLSCPDGPSAGVNAGGSPQLLVQRVGEKVKSANAPVFYAVRLAGGPKPVEAFGLEVAYDPSLVRFSSAWERGELTTDFTQVGVNEVEVGSIRVGGFNVGEPIPAGADGVLAMLEFEALSYTPSRLSILNPVDDVASFTVSSGR